MVSQNVPYGKISTVSAVGQLIRRRRKDARVLQTEAARLAGVGTRLLSELERGKATAEIGKVLAVLDRLGLEVWIIPKTSQTAWHLREELE